MPEKSIYASVTDRILKELEEGAPPWVRPWKNGHASGVNLLPANLISGRWYSGINVLILWHRAISMGFPTMGYCTYQQAGQIGANVRKGEKAALIVFVKRVEKEEDGEKKKSTVLKSYAVFNVAQLENVPPAYSQPEPPEERTVVHDRALELMNKSGVTVIHGGNKAAYYPHRDQIVLPPFGSFEDEDAYWGTTNHELIHATAHETRLKRKFGKRFGDKVYGMEELVAELGSAFLCARLGIPASFRSASYLQSWIATMKEDNRAIFTASSYASQAADWLWEKAFYTEEEKPPSEVERQPEPAL